MIQGSNEAGSLSLKLGKATRSGVSVRVFTIPTYRSYQPNPFNRTEAYITLH